MHLLCSSRSKNGESRLLHTKEPNLSSVQLLSSFQISTVMSSQPGKQDGMLWVLEISPFGKEQERCSQVARKAVRNLEVPLL